MSDNNDGIDLKLKPFDWVFYLQPFLKDSIINKIKPEIDQKQYTNNEGLFNLILYFQIKKSPTQPEATTSEEQNKQYLLEKTIQKAQEPLCAQFMANKYVREQNIPKSLYYCLFASLSIPIHVSNFSNILLPLEKFYSNNQKSISHIFELYSDQNIAEAQKKIITYYLHFKFEQDHILQAKLFSELIKYLISIDDENEISLLVFEILLGLDYYENIQSKEIILYLCGQLKTQQKFIIKMKQQFDVIFSQLSEDHELFQALRYKLKQFMIIREYLWQIRKSESNEEKNLVDPQVKIINSEIDINLLKILRNINECSSNIIKDNEYFEMTYLYSKILKFMAKQELHDQWQQIKLVKILELHCSTKMTKMQLNFVNSTLLKLKTISFKIRTRKIHEELKSDLKNLEVVIANYISQIRVKSIEDLNEKFDCLLILRKPNHLLSKLYSPNQNNTTILQTPSNINFSFAMTPSTQTQFTFSSNQFDTQSVISDHSDANIQVSYEKIVQNQALRAQYFFEEFQFELNKFNHLLAYHKIGQKYGFQSKNLTHNYFSVNYLRKSQLFNLDLASINTSLKEFQENQIKLNKLLKLETFYESHIGEIRNLIQNQKEKIPCFVKIYKCSSNEKQIILQNILKKQGQANANPTLGYFINNQELGIISHLRYNCLSEMLKFPILSQCKIIDIIKNLSIIIARWHANGYIIGNLKCSNVFYEQGTIYLTDFWVTSNKNQRSFQKCLDVDNFDLEEDKFFIDNNQTNFQIDYEMFAQIISELIYALNKKQFKIEMVNSATLGWLKKEGYGSIYQIVNSLLTSNGKQAINTICKEVNSWI